MIIKESVTRKISLNFAEFDVSNGTIYMQISIVIVSKKVTSIFEAMIPVSFYFTKTCILIPYLINLMHAIYMFFFQVTPRCWFQSRNINKIVDFCGYFTGHATTGKQIAMFCPYNTFSDNGGKFKCFDSCRGPCLICTCK